MHASFSPPPIIFFFFFLYFIMKFFNWQQLKRTQAGHIHCDTKLVSCMQQWLPSVMPNKLIVSVTSMLTLHHYVQFSSSNLSKHSIKKWNHLISFKHKYPSGRGTYSNASCRSGLKIFKKKQNNAEVKS